MHKVNTCIHKLYKNCFLNFSPRVPISEVQISIATFPLSTRKCWIRPTYIAAWFQLWFQEAYLKAPLFQRSDLSGHDQTVFKLLRKELQFFSLLSWTTLQHPFSRKPEHQYGGFRTERAKVNTTFMQGKETHIKRLWDLGSVVKKVFKL